MDLKEVHLTDVEAAWLAAAIDGEGYISFFLKDDHHSHRHPSEWPKIVPTIEIANNSKPFLEYAKKIIGAGGVYSQGSKNCFNYRLFTKSLCSQVLKQIFPFLIIKKYQARKVMQFCDRQNGGYTLEDLHIYEAVKRANYNGRAPLLGSDRYKKLKKRLENKGDDK